MRRQNNRNWIGKTYGKLTILSEEVLLREKQRNIFYWRCLCACGTTTRVRKFDLTSGRTRSCGCLRKTVLQKQSLTHGQSYSQKGAYNAWRGMRERCLNEKHISFKNYGAKGIRVTDKWNDFRVFYRDMGDPPSNNHSLDRINGELGYFKKNCRWATRKQQNRNRRITARLTVNGVTKPLSEWAETSGVNSRALRERIYKLKWSPEEAISTPLLNSKAERRLYSAPQARS